MSQLRKIYPRLCVAIALCFLNTFAVSQASTSIKNRNDVFGALNQLNANTTMPGLDIWVNENLSDPFVEIGDAVYFTMKSDEPAFHTLIHVDSKGSTAIFSPELNSHSGSSAGSDYLVYPQLNRQCSVYKKSDVCFNLANMLTQQEPVGKDTVFLLASKQPISPDVLGIRGNRDFRDLGKNLSEIEYLVQRINAQSVENPLAVVRYAYSVESETQYKTRGLEYAVKKMEEQANNDEIGNEQAQSLTFDNINFTWNSDDLTVPSMVELDGLGSALVDLQEQNGEFPLVELIGHTDSTGPDVYNASLSASRAQSAKRYLVSEHGIPADLVVTVGAGESMPIDSNETRTGRAKNRRVEFSVIRSR